MVPVYRSLSSAFLLLAIVPLATVGAEPHTVAAAHNPLYTQQMQTAQEHASRIQRLTLILHKLIIDGELCTQSEQRRTAETLLKRVRSELAEKKSSSNSNYEMAQALLTVVMLDPGTPSVDMGLFINKSLTTFEATERLLTYIETRIAQRGIGVTQLISRPLFDTLEKYKFPIALFIIPCLAVGAQATYTNYIAAPAGSPKNECETALIKQFVDAFAKHAAKPIAAGASFALFSSDNFRNGACKTMDWIKSKVAQLRGMPYSDSNPAKSSKLSLTDTPAPESTKNYLRLLAQAIVDPESTLRMRGALPRALTIIGDRSLAADLARGFTHEINQRHKEAGLDITCKIAIIHASKLTAKSLKDEIDKIKEYNQSAVIVISDVDWLVDASDEGRTAAITEIINGIGAALRPHERYAVIITARDDSKIDPILRQATLFAPSNTIKLEPSQNPALTRACFTRIEQLFGILITKKELIAQMTAYLHENSFGELVTLVTKAYTKSLPHLLQQPLTQETIMHELAIAHEGTVAV